MDTYCVNLEVLLDNPTVETLRDPQIHSYHCLVDVPRCIEGGFEILVESSSATGLWGRFLRLDTNETQQTVELARAYGAPGGCSTCTGTLGNEMQGFRATVIGSIIPDSGMPPVLDTQRVVSYAEGCPEGMTGMTPNSDDLSFDAGYAQSKVLAHGLSMLISLGFFVPLEIVTARFLHHRPNALWFKIHLALQIVGMLFAIAGWAIALRNFNILESDVVTSGTSSSLERKAYVHAACGTTAMCLGLLQPLNALLRPNSPAEGEEKAKARYLWEILHKSMGYIATVATCSCHNRSRNSNCGRI